MVHLVHSPHLGAVPLPPRNGQIGAICSSNGIFQPSAVPSHRDMLKSMQLVQFALPSAVSLSGNGKVGDIGVVYPSENYPF